MKDSKKALKLSSTVFKMREEVQRLEVEKVKAQNSLDRQLSITIMIGALSPIILSLLLMTSDKNAFIVLGIGMGFLTALLTLSSAVSLMEKKVYVLYNHQEIIKAKKRYLELVGENFYD